MKTASISLNNRLSISLSLTNVSYQHIAAWQDAQTDLIHAGGMAAAAFTGAAGVNGSTTGRTLISPAYALAQDTLIRQVKANVKTWGLGNNVFKFKLFRWNATGSTFDFVTESALLTPAGTGTQTWTLATPIQAQMGDVPAWWVKDDANAIGYSGARAVASRYTAGDITGANVFASTLATAPELECLSCAPYLAVTGDSIPEGHNAGSAADWHGRLHDVVDATIPGGFPTAEIANQLRGLIGDGTVLQYQNLALGSQTFAWVASTGIVESLAVKPHTVLIHCGANDVNTGRTWAQVEADLDTIAAAAAAATPSPTLLIDEIFPWTAGNDTQAALIRTWNANLATWCNANGTTLVLCHDAMGQVRGTTGELDDLITAYNHDGVHLTAPAGTSAAAAIWKAYL